MPEAHSHIGASSAYRWMNCPGSVGLYGQLTERRVSEYAQTGTLAHLVCEMCLRTNSDPIRYLNQKLTIEDGTELVVTEEIVASVKVYVEHVRRVQAEHGGELVVEQSFDLSWLHAGMFGRNDAALLPEVFGTLYVFDYKNGRKPVTAENNSQLAYYALGALGKDNPRLVEEVVAYIVQPNCFGKEPVDEWRVSVKELYAWAHEVLLPAALRTEAPDAPCVSGEWCCFCEAAGLCPLRQSQALALLDSPVDECEVATLPAVAELTPERIGLLSAFFTSEAFQSWVKSLAAEEQALLAQGVEIPGRKLVETRVQGNRRWAEETKVVEALRDLCGADLFDTKLKSPAAVEKLLTGMRVVKAEREAMLAPLVVRDVTTKTIVVSEQDARPSVAAKQKEAIELFD